MTVVVYTVMLILLMLRLGAAGVPQMHASGVVILCVLGAIALLCYASGELLLDRLGRALDCGLALVAVALVVAGPVAALGVALIPDLVRVARRPGFARSPALLANVTSYAACVAAGAAVLSLVPTAGAASAAAAVLAAGPAILLVNYVVARLLFAWLRDGADPRALVRAELVAALPAELSLIALAALCAGLLPLVGVLALSVFGVVVVLPQLALASLLHTRSVARLDAADAATVYRAALAAELGLSRDARRAMEGAARLVSGAPPGAMTEGQYGAALRLAGETEICLRQPPTQAAYRALPATQVILVAERWAALTARCTPALSHSEALTELLRTPLVSDAPAALVAAARISARESALTAHSTAVPRLHRLCLHGRLRPDAVLGAVDRLRA